MDHIWGEVQMAAMTPDLKQLLAACKPAIELKPLKDSRLDELVEYHFARMVALDAELHGGAEHDEDEREMWLADKQSVDAIKELKLARAQLAVAVAALEYRGHKRDCAVMRLRPALQACTCHHDEVLRALRGGAE